MGVICGRLLSRFLNTQEDLKKKNLEEILLQVIWNLHPRCFETGKFLQRGGEFVLQYFSWQCFNDKKKKHIYELNGDSHNITEVIKGWQLLDHKILPVSSPNDQHLVVGGQD